MTNETESQEQRRNDGRIIVEHGTIRPERAKEIFANLDRWQWLGDINSKYSPQIADIQNKFTDVFRRNPIVAEVGPVCGSFAMFMDDVRKAGGSKEEAAALWPTMMWLDEGRTGIYRASVSFDCEEGLASLETRGAIAVPKKMGDCLRGSTSEVMRKCISFLWKEQRMVCSKREGTYRAMVFSPLTDSKLTFEYGAYFNAQKGLAGMQPYWENANVLQKWLESHRSEIIEHNVLAKRMDEISRSFYGREAGR